MIFPRSEHLIGLLPKVHSTKITDKMFNRGQSMRECCHKQKKAPDFKSPEVGTEPGYAGSRAIVGSNKMLRVKTLLHDCVKMEKT